MQLASGLNGGLIVLVLFGCGQVTPPPLSPRTEEQDAILDEGNQPHAGAGLTDENMPNPKREPLTTATPEAGQSTGSAQASSADSSACTGEATPALLESLRARGESSKSCFAALLSRGTEAKGQVKVGLKIAAHGNVTNITFEGDDVADATFSQCLRGHFGSTFAETPPDRGCLEVKVPLNFSVKKGTATN